VIEKQCLGEQDEQTKKEEGRVTTKETTKEI